jgi:aspartyl-tRNA(Asn)/glutamyl-tRNA(Gln) amidotransferase subunit C
MPIDEDEVRRIAALAELELDETEIARLSHELGRILGYVRQLEEVDTEGVEPSAQGELAPPALRPDEPAASLDRALVLGEAPRAQAGGFAVPGFVEE